VPASTVNVLMVSSPALAMNAKRGLRAKMVSPVEPCTEPEVAVIVAVPTALGLATPMRPAVVLMVTTWLRKSSTSL